MKSTICLSMVCKNEAAFIRGALASVKPFIDCWSVLDTGSTDGTQDAVREMLSDLPGTLHEQPWKGWDKSRTESVDLAKKSGCDFILILDADETVTVPSGFQMPDLDVNKAYWMTVCYGGIEYTRPSLVSAKHSWRYVGVTHEYLMAPEKPAVVVLPMRIVTNPTRATKTTEKCATDAELLEKGLIDEPGNTRYQFYLAQSYRDSLQNEKAIAAYQKRATMGGWFEEVFISLLQVARLQERQGMPEETVINSYLKAYDSNPERSESLGMLVDYLNRRSRYATSYVFANKAKDMIRPNQQLFIDLNFYDWRNLDLYSVAAYWTGRYTECIQACSQLLSSDKTPTEQRIRIKANSDCAFSKLSGTIKSSNKMKVLVVIPTQGTRPEMLLEAQGSVMLQTRKPDQVIVTDEKVSLADKVNNALDKSGCDCFVLLGDDDLLEPTFIEKTVALMESTGCDIVNTKYRHFGAEDLVTGRAGHISITSLFRKSAWVKAGKYANCPYLDWDLALSCSEIGTTSHFIAEPLWQYRIHPGQDTEQETEADRERNRAIVMARHPKAFKAAT